MFQETTIYIFYPDLELIYDLKFYFENSLNLKIILNVYF